MQIFFKLLVSTLAILPLISNAQTGPGGIGNSAGAGAQPKLTLWLDAKELSLTNGNDLLNWTDQSGNGYDLSAVSATSPIFRSSGPNGQPYAEFSKTDNRIVLTPFDDMPDREISVFIVNQTTDSGEGLVSYAVTGSDNELLIFNSSSMRTYIDGSENNSGVAYNSGNWQVYGMHWQSAGGNLELFLNNGVVQTTTHRNGSVLTQGGSFAIGGEQDGVNSGYAANQAFQGSIAEIIVYDHYINEVERIILSNYLSAKYNITLSANDQYAGDDGGNGNFDQDVIGIGQFAGQQHQSSSNAGLTLNPEGTSLDQDNEFIFAGHATTTNTTTVAGVSGSIEERWLRTWYIDKSGTTGATIGFDFNEGIGGLYPADLGDYRLLRWNGSGFDIVTTSGTVINGSEVRFTVTNANLTDGIYTIGTTDASNSPLTGVSNSIWYSYQSGDWTDPNTWTLDGSVVPTYNNPGARIPSAIDDVVITNGRVVSADIDNITTASMEVLGTLDIAATSGHSFTVISGNGTIRLSGSGTQLDNFPAGDASLFSSASTGGTVEWYGTGLTLDAARTFNNVIVNLSSGSDIVSLEEDLSLNGSLTIEQGVLRINDGTNGRNLDISANGDVIVQPAGSIQTGTGNARHQFNFYGDLINNGGTIAFTNRTSPNYNTEATNGITDANFLNANLNQAIVCNGESVFYRIEIDKGEDATYILDITASTSANFQLFGPADYGHGSNSQLATNDNSLGLLRGTVRLNENVIVPVLNNTGNYNISENARLWVNGGGVTKTAGTAIVIYGTIQLSSGTVDAPVQSGLTTRLNGNIVVSGGVMTIRQIRTSVEGINSVGGYTQSGGTVFVTGGSYQTDYYVFSLTYPGNTFAMSGGTLHVSGVTGSGSSGRQGGIFISSQPGNINVTGGTVIMDNTTSQNFKVTSTAPFWNVIMRETGGSSTEVELDAGTSGDNSPGEFVTLSNPKLRILNNLTIENGVIFDHNGFDVEVGGNFTIEGGADYLYSAAKPNTTTINGTANSTLSFFNRTGGPDDEQQFWNMIIDKPANRTVTLASGKSDLTGNENNLLRVNGNSLKLLSGILDNGAHSVRVYSDSLINYQQIGLYIPANATPDNTTNGNNDLIKMRPDPFILVTADTSLFGNVRLNSEDAIVTMISDVRMQRLEYRHGRIDLQNHELTIDNLFVNLANGETRTDEDSNGNFSVEDMFIMNGNPSDGGLSLYVPAGGNNPGFINMSGAGNTTTNPTMFFFPIGTGTTGVDATSEFTPANIRLLSAADDGYINVKVVKGKLPTAGPYPLGNDVSNRYWIVNYEGFSTPPVVERIWFRSVEKDDPNGGPNGFPGNYVPGYVLDSSPYTRTAEIAGAAPSTSGFQTSGSTNLRIFFWGNTGSGNPAGGFNLVEAAYTAGDPSKFVGAPVVYYNRNNGIRNWNDNAKWTVNSDGSDDGSTDIPGTGDVVILRNYGQGNQNAWVYLNIDISIARLDFDNSFGGWRPRLWITRRNAIANLGIVSGTGEIYVEHTITQQPVFTGSDFGNFADEENSFFVFRADQNNTNPIPLPADIDIYPNLRIEGGNGGFNQRITQNTFPITINKDMWVDWGGTFSAGDDIHIKGRLRVGAGGGARGLFEIYDAKKVVVNIDDDLELLDNTGDPRMTVRNTNQNSYQHEVRVGGDILIEDGIFDLYNGTGTNNNATLIFDGAGSVTFTRPGGNLPDLFRIGMEKLNGRQDVVNIQTNFALNGPTNTVDKAIYLTSGILQLNNAAIDVTLSSLGNYSIPAQAGLRMTQGIARVSGDNTGIILDGCIEIVGGTLDMDEAGNGNNFIEYSSSGNALLSISGGSLLVGSQIRPLISASTGVLRYRQTGGDVVIGINAAPQSNRGMLQIYNPGSEFTYTGGTLTIARHQTSPTVAALFLDPETSAVSSPITIFNGNTPAGQSDFRINSTIPLSDLVIQGNNSPTARLFVNPLIIEGNLTVAANATFDADNLDLTLRGNFINDGIYIADGNETFFETETTQTYSGTGTGDFFDVTKSGAGVLDFLKDATLLNRLQILDGVMDDNGNNIFVQGNVVNDGIHRSSGSSQGLVFSGSASQQITRTEAGIGYFGTVTINNAAGVVIPDGNGYNFQIATNLRLAQGVFNIGGSLLTIEQLAGIVEVNPFSVTNMIQTNSSFTDNGVRKFFPSGFTQNFTFPVGELLYTPAIFDFSTGGNTFGSSAGSITIRPSAEFHPVVNDGTDFYASGDINNVLQYYWIIETSGVTNFTSDLSLIYDQSDVLTDEPGLDESDYISARILANENPTNAINKFTTADVNEATNTIQFRFSGANANAISGDYFAGIDEAIPDNVTTYTSLVNGNVVDPIYDLVVPGGGAPNGAILRVATGTTVRFNVNQVNLYRTEIEAGGVLEIDQTTQHRLGIVTGEGVLRIVSNTINATLPAGFYNDFFSCSGGGLEYSGSGSYSIMSGITQVRTLDVTGSGIKSVADNNILICEDMSINGPEVRGNSQNSITVQNDFILTSGTMVTPTGTNGRVIVERDMIINGGLYRGAISSGSTVVNRHMTLNGGTLNIGGQVYVVRVRGTLSRSGGSFQGGTNSARLILDGTSSQNVVGNFTGANAWRRAEVNNSAGIRLVGDVSVTDIILLENGLINTLGNEMLLTQTATASPAAGRANSYVNGKLYKEIPAGQSFTFPIGKGAFWRNASVNNVTSGTRTWEAEYFRASPLDFPTVDNLDPLDLSIVTISASEYWVINDGSVAATGTQASIGLSWGVESDVSASTPEREKLVVLKWNDGLSGWDNLGGENFSSGHSQDRGNFTSIISTGFSEHVFTLGSTDAINPLPITLEYFKGRTMAGTNVLEWRTLAEINNDFFEVQRSTDGESYEVIATIEGSGTSNSPKFYQYIDQAPNGGINYYRLKQIDFDGTSSYSENIVRLENDASDQNILFTLFPNPTTQDNIQMRVRDNKDGYPIVIKIHDMYGREVFAGEFIQEETETIHRIQPSTRLRSGIYMVVLYKGVEKITRRLVIK
jgi:hypothetical protein